MDKLLPLGDDELQPASLTGTDDTGPLNMADEDDDPMEDTSIPSDVEEEE